MDDLRQPTLELVTASNLLDLAGELIAEHHQSLVDARISWIFALGKPLSFWGRTKVATEELWRLTGGPREGTDIVILVNESLWLKLTPDGRRFLLDLLLAFVSRKEGGQTAMETGPDEEDRLLYQINRHSLGVDPRVLARNPKGYLELDELAKLDKAMRDPAQFMLDLQAADAGDEDSEEEDDTSATAAVRDPEPPVYYYETRRLTTGLRKGWLVYLQYSDASKTPLHLTGVHFPADQSEIKAGADPVDKSALSFDQSPEAIRTYRQALVDELEIRRLEALEATGSADLGEPALYEGEDHEEETWDEPALDTDEEMIEQAVDDLVDAHPEEDLGAVLPMRGRR